MKELLNSDRVNFLVWRYLLESNYRETAAKFQKEWHIHEPHRHFDFAPHVQNHALISVLNRGLQYHALEREHARRQAPQEAAVAVAEALQVGVFGPLVAQPPRKLDEDDDEDGDHEEDDEVGKEDHEMPTRKRHLDSRPDLGSAEMNGGGPAKKPRLSNGVGPGYESRADTATTVTAMDIDGSGTGENNNAYPSPLEGEQAPTPIARTEGPEQGTQVDKVQELTPRTTFLRLTAYDESASASVGAISAAEATSPASVQDAAESAPIVLHCEWNPTDPSILAAGGTDALARVWTISRATTAGAPANDQLPNHVSSITRPGRDMKLPTPTTSVTALAWNWDGTAVALATDDGSRARVTIYSLEGEYTVECFICDPPVLKVRWSTNNAAVLAVSPHSQGMLVSVFHLPSEVTLQHVQVGHDLQNYAFDAAWTSDNDFLLCGADVFVSLHCSDTGISLAKKFETRPEDHFSQVLFDMRSKLAATSSDKGVLDLWDEGGQRRSISAHSGQITAMQWQPLQSNPADDERLIVTGGDDCAILIWNARIPESKAKCCVTMEYPVVAVSFTPDGAFLAGASYNQILIWKVGDHAIPRASWSRTPHPAWLSPKVNPDGEEEDSYSLGWDSTGQKLAFGGNSRLAVIDFR